MVPMRGHTGTRHTLNIMGKGFRKVHSLVTLSSYRTSMSNIVNKKRINCWLSTNKSRFECQLFTVVWESQVPSSQGLWGPWEMVTPWTGGKKPLGLYEAEFGSILALREQRDPQSHLAHAPGKSE